MFRIADGREHFYQWDLDRQVIVEDNSIVEVHFCNRTDNCSLVVDVVDGLANVPNILLQKSFDIRVFGYDGKATRYDEVFKVKPRTQPSDYKYTETVIKSVSEILEAAEQVSSITTEFYEFVDEYKVGLVDDGQGNVELKAVEKEGGGGDVDVSGKMDKVAGGKSGNFINLDADGNAKDSGYNSNSFVPMLVLTGSLGPHISNDKIHLPAVTTNDDGKLLTVVNGQWKATTLPNAEGGAY